MRIDDAYDRWAPSYDRDVNVTRDLDHQVAAELWRGWRVPMVVEAGCGTGKNTALYASIADEVLALDFSERMLALARDKVDQPHVRFERANLLERWPCDDERAGLVAFNLVLEHVEDLRRPLREAARVLAPGGLLLVSELHPARQYAGSQARFADDAGQVNRIEAYTHHLSDYLRAAANVDLALDRLDEWWHAEDVGKAPRLLTLVFRKPGDAGGLADSLAEALPRVAFR